MRTSGSSRGRKLGLGFAALAVLAAAGIAAELWVEEIPSGNSYVVTASLVPGADAEVCGGDRDQGHVNFRIGFLGGAISVNGVDAGSFDPAAAYSVTVSAWKCGPQWLASTQVHNLTTGQPVFEQLNYKMSAAANEAWASASDVLDLSAE
ncbi:MAG: hypothetical protein L6Q95_14525 [Planctomycetes bacterium]|nr:hypothetical protein [Planctomycetota bacterium]